MQRFNQAPLKCLAGDEVARVLKEIYAGVCGSIKWALWFIKVLTIWVIIGPSWNQMQFPLLDSKHVDLIRMDFTPPTPPPPASPVELYSLSTPWPSWTWAFNLVDHINPPSPGYIWILGATKCYTKGLSSVSKMGKSLLFSRKWSGRGHHQDFIS